MTRASRWLSVIKNSPAMQETHVPPLGWEDPLEKEMAILSSILAWKIPWTEESGGLQSISRNMTRMITKTLITAPKHIKPYRHAILPSKNLQSKQRIIKENSKSLPHWTCVQHHLFLTFHCDPPV